MLSYPTKNVVAESTQKENVAKQICRIISFPQTQQQNKLPLQSWVKTITRAQFEKII